MRYRYLWRAWYNMIKRCTDESAPCFHRYGGRGIAVCHEWLISFDAFARDVGERPSKGFSLDRINNDDGYHPGNVRWADAKTQSNNRDSSIRLNGETVEQAAARCGIKPCTIYKRLHKGLPPLESKDMRRSGIKHGTIAGYSYYKCRCDKCRSANTAKARARKSKVKQENHQ